MLSEFYLFKTDLMPSSCLKSWGTRDWCLWVIQSTGTNGSLSCAWWRPQYLTTGSRYASSMAHSSPLRHWYDYLHKSTAYRNQQFYLVSLFEHIIIFQEYNATIDFYWSPLLVESNSDNPIIHRVEYRIIRADRIEKHASVWRDADIIVFNSYLWWRKQKDDMRMKVM